MYLLWNNLLSLPANKTASIAILGFGLEGKTTYAFLRKHGYRNITICDKNDHLGDLPKSTKRKLGKNYLKNLAEYKIIFRSPGIPFLSKEIQDAKKAGACISSQTSYVFQHAPCMIIGITGTKGKGTTASMLYHILKLSRKKVFLGGNIGEAPINLLEKLTPKSILVLELSSFQLQDLQKSPRIAVVLNVTSEHLDHHETTEEYVQAKESIVAYQSENDYTIVNQDYAGSSQYADKTPAHIFTVSCKKPVDQGAYVQGDIIYIKLSGEPITLCHTRDIALLGGHNLENILPAVTVAALLKCPRKAILQTLKTFKGLPHRLEFVAQRKGVEFYNDSASTVPDAAIAAIKTFKSPLILIAGGSEKYPDFTDLARVIVTTRNLKTVILIGKTAKRLKHAIEDANNEATEIIEHAEKTGQKVDIKRDLPLKIIQAENLLEAMLALKLQATAGDTVLLSPACASFGEFRNYKHRGEVFCALVKKF